MGALFGGIESGGTKWVCAVGDGPQNILAETRFANTTPAETIAQAIAFFQQQEQLHGRIAAIGIGSFGPLDLRSGSAAYGYITTTPKPGWANTDVVGPIHHALNIPVGFDTDVNAAALGEYRWGAAQNLSDFLYLTIGTGIGGGAMVNGKLLHGLLHTEMGHVLLSHDRQVDPYPGYCVFHGDCLEGLACGPALNARWGQRAETLPHDHPAWKLEADYLAHALVSFICTLSPQRIILGGGVMDKKILFPMIRKRVGELLNGYFQAPEMMENIDNYIVPPVLGGRAGVLGAIALAQLSVGGLS